MKGRLLFVFSIIFIASSAIDSESHGFGEWQILTKQNFSSQIRLHPNILLIVTLPWCGESRSLMKEVAGLVTDRQEEYGALKLMCLYRNTEKMLADAIGATEGITIIYYHHSTSYKYRGRLRAENILSSVYPYTSLLPEDVPLKLLNTPGDLNTFLESTDKAILLLEFCGWTPKLLSKGKKNGTETGFGMLGDAIGKDFNGETTRGKNNQNQKETENAKLKCETENQFSGIPWLGEFSSVNDSALEDSEINRRGVELSCTFEAFQRFDSFFSKFMTVARELFLPIEKHRFGLVSERSLLSSLGVRDSGSWLVRLYITGCPNCSKIIKEEDDLESIIKMHTPFVRELEDGGYAHDPALPENKPSIYLFVDRTSNSSETKRKSKESLNAFRELALQYQMGGQNNDNPEKSSVQAYHAFRSTPSPPKLKLSLMAQKKKNSDKMSVMIKAKHITLNNIASDLQASSLQEILAHLLKKKREQKLSSLAKDVGFQLLSDDFDIKVADTLVSLKEDQSTQVSTEPSKEGQEGLITNTLDLNKDQLPYASISSEVQEEKSKSTLDEPSALDDEEQTTVAAINEHPVSVEPDNIVFDQDLISEYVTAEDKQYLVDQFGRQELQYESFTGSFFFSDGNFRLLRSLTGGSKTPSLVIIDPISQKHYVFPEDTIMSYDTLADFINGYLNGHLLPYQRSESVLPSPREATHPPFVNLDFREMNSIPRVTARTFSELVLGFNDSGTENVANAWNKDVLVLFSNSWCGFCQRMELVVREFYRALKGYINMLESGSRNGETMFSGDNFKDMKLKVPMIYLMDCTLNDCRLILRSINQRDVFPSLLLFPAERKTAISYGGDIAVANVIKFIANHGSNSHHLASEKGILRFVANKGGRAHNLFEDQSETETQGKAYVADDKFHEVLLKNRTPQREIKYNQMKSRTSKGSHNTGPYVVVGSIFVATEKLLNAHPFDKSTILIVKADQNSGFQGLIINKQIRWDVLHELEAELEVLKQAPLSFGGPLLRRGMPLVALTRRFIKDQYPEVLPGVYFLNQVATIQEFEELKSGNQSTTDYWFFFGYSSWGWDQLYDELAEGAWRLNEDNVGHFDWPEV